MKKLILYLAVLLPNFIFSANLPSGFIEKEIASNLDPSGIELLPDGRVLVIEKYGQISVVVNDELLSTVFLQLDVDNSNERGLQGLVIDPNFEINNYFYVFYTTNSGFNRVSRFTANGNQALLESELILFEFDNLSSKVHNGGAMIFGEDGKLYFSSGDGGNQSNSQNLSSNLGKMLRINSDGSIPEDNPYYNTLDGKNRAIYALGVRNPFSITKNENGLIIFSDVGGSDFEEINYLEEGANYGWPNTEGYLKPDDNEPDNYKEPEFVYSHEDGHCAIVGLEVYTPELKSFPEKFWRNIFYGDFCTNQLYLLDLETNETEVFASGLQQLTVIEIAPNGDLYYIQRSNTSGSIQDNTEATDGALFKISYTGSGLPFVSKQPENINEVVGGTAVFEVTASGDNPLDYQWFVNNIESEVSGNKLELSNLSLSNNGNTIYCKISNTLGTVYTDTVSLTVIENTRPEPTITISNISYIAGDTIFFSGTAIDTEDGEINPSTLRWQIDFHHDDHTHPFLNTLFGEEGFAVIPRVGETATNVFYRVHLIATDSDGFSGNTYIDILPIINNLFIGSNVDGITYFLDGKTITSDTTITGVAGITRQIKVGTVQQSASSDSIFIFNGFNDIIEDNLTVFPFPTNDSTISLNFTSNFHPGEGLSGKFYHSLEDFENKTNSTGEIISAIDFDWEDGSPTSGVNTDLFYTRFEGYIRPAISGEYTFIVNGDDGINLFIDSFHLIKDWTNHGILEEFSGTIYLEEGVFYPITLEHFEEYGSAGLKLSWESDFFDREIVPENQLYIDLISGLSEIKHHSFYVSPNPVESTAILTFDSAGKKDISVRLANALGKTVQTTKFITSSKKLELDLSGLKSGIYYASIINEGEVISTEKIVKK